MANRFATLVVVIIIALLALFAFQNFYQPTNQRGEIVQAPVEGETISTSLEPFSLSNAWLIPDTNIMFRHNASIENGKRIDFVTLDNSGSRATFNLLVIAPKKLAKSASEIDLTGNPRVLKEDPEFLYENVVFDEGSPQSRQYALLVDVSRSTSEIPGVMYIPIRGLTSAEAIVNLADIFSQYSDFFDSLSTREAFEVEYRITSIMSQVRPAPDLLQDVETYLADLRDPRATSSLPLAQLSPLTTKISIYSPRNDVSITICKLPDCSTPQQAQARPLVRVEGEVAPYARIVYEDLPTDPARIKINLHLDFSTAEIKAADLNFPNERGNQKRRLSGTIIVAYPGHLNLQTTTSLTVERPLANAVRVVPTEIPSGAGGSFVFITSDLPFLLDGVTSNCFIEPIDLRGASPLAATAIVLYVSPSAKQPLPTCRFAQNGEIIEEVQFRVNSREARPTGLTQLYPVVATAYSWRTCAENYCTCDAARDAFESAVTKVREDSLQYYNPYYPFQRFQETFVFNLANFEQSCNFGVEFSPTAQPKPGTIQLVEIKVDPNNRNAPAEAAAFYAASNFIPGVISASLDEIPSDRQVRRTVVSQWLCHDSDGLPSPQPNHECSQELRSPPVVTVATAPIID